MNETTNQLLRDLAAKLGTTSEYLWGVLVAGQRAEAIGTSVAIVIEALVIAAAFIASAKCYAKYVEDSKGASRYEEPIGWVITTIICAAIGSVTLLPFAFDAYNLAMYLSAPEYMALKQLLQIMGKH